MKEKKDFTINLDMIHGLISALGLYHLLLISETHEGLAEKSAYYINYNHVLANLELELYHGTDLYTQEIERISHMISALTKELEEKKQYIKNLEIELEEIKRGSASNTVAIPKIKYPY